MSKEIHFLEDGYYVDKLEKENQQLKDKLKSVQEERDYLFNKQSIENKYLAQENQKLKEVIEEVREYIKNNVFHHIDDYNYCEYDEIEGLDKLLQILDKVKNV